MKRLSFLVVVLVCLLGLTPQPLDLLTARAEGAEDAGDPLGIALEFLGEHHRDYSLNSDLTDLRLLQVVPSLGADHVRFQQTYQGIPVYGAYVTVHIDKATKRSPEVTNRYVPAIQVSTTKTGVTEETAIEIATGAVGVRGQLRADITSQLLIYPRGDEHVLAWQVGIPAREPLGDWEVFVDALDATVLDRFNRMRIDGRSPQGEIEKGKASIRTREPTHMVRHYFGPGKVGPMDVPKSSDDEGISILEWTTIWADGFEGAFPGPWNVFDNDGDTNGEYYWDDDPYRPHTEDWEVWPANGGADALLPPTNYPNHADSWMVYGPFDLSDAADAELLFYYWSITESGYDYFFWGASIDGTGFYGTVISGDYSSGTAGNNFYLEDFDLTDVYTLGNLAGQPQVWIAFVFQSDYSITYEGTYVDDVVIRKDTASCGGDPNTGYAFNPNPVVTSGDTSLVDNGNADTATLTAERQLINLLGLNGSGQLVGPHVDLTAPGITGAYKPAGQANEAACLYYDYTRSDDRFEEVTIYYQIDSVQRYIQSLGFTNVNNRAVPAHAHYFADDNSFYSSVDLGLHFGDGGVDDGEDGDIIVHEYGHAIQDNQVPGWGATHEGGSMGEGFSDYLAASFFASANGGFNRECVADWDATSYSTDNPPCLRRLDGTKHYPEDMQGQVHADGEIWSAALWDLWLALGSEVTNRLVIESHFYLDPMSEFEDGANAILSADQDLYGGSNRATICNVFRDRGILDQCEGLRLAVTTAHWDDIGSILTQMGYSWTEISDADIANYSFLSEFDVVFANCNGYTYDYADAATGSLQQFVQNGGSFYASDFAYTYINAAFPEHMTFPDDPHIGQAQQVTADIVDAGLANYLDPANPPSAVDIEYDLSGWVPIQDVASTTTVHLRGSFSTSASAGLSAWENDTHAVSPGSRQSESVGALAQESNKPLSGSFEPYGDSGGRVIYTTFHNKAQLSEIEEKLLEYLVLIPSTRQEQQQVEQVMASEGVALVRTDINVIDPGEVSPLFTYVTSGAPKLVFAVAWGGSSLRLSVYGPDGSPYDEVESTSSPISIVIVDAEAGSWKYQVTGVDVPHNNYRYVVGIGEPLKFYVPLATKKLGG